MLLAKLDDVSRLCYFTMMPRKSTSTATALSKPQQKAAAPLGEGGAIQGVKKAPPKGPETFVQDVVDGGDLLDFATFAKKACWTPEELTTALAGNRVVSIELAATLVGQLNQVDAGVSALDNLSGTSTDC